MSELELLLLAVGLSMDAFAVAVCAGVTMKRATLKKALIVGLYFGVFQAAMPLVGYWAAGLFADKIIDYDHWIAFALLCFLGGKMTVESFKNRGRKAVPPESEAEEPLESGDDESPEFGDDRPPELGDKEPNKLGDKRPGESGGKEPPADEKKTLRPGKMLPLALATSIDAMAAGLSFAFLQVKILPAVSFIGATTLILLAAGVKIGQVFGVRFRQRAELAGGVILIMIGFKILLEHLGLFG